MAENRSMKCISNIHNRGEKQHSLVSCGGTFGGIKDKYRDCFNKIF